MGRRDTWQQWNNTLKLKPTEKKILTWHRQACTWHTHTVHLPNDPWEADVPRNVFSDWLKCPWGWWRKCDERLTGGEGEAEWKEAELPRDPGIFTGAELCSKLPPGQRTHREDGYVWPWGVGTGRSSEQEVSGSLSPPWAPRDSPSTSPEGSSPSHPLRGALKLPSHDPHRFKPSTIQWITLSVAKGTKGFLSKLSPCQSREDEFDIWWNTLSWKIHF